ncbi:MAG: hypothetical protein WCH34_01535 [Bacteroidota bacterium]
MNKFQTVRYFSLKKAQDFNTIHSVILALILEYAYFVAKLNNVVARIEAAKQKQATSSTSATGQKETFKLAMAILVIQYAFRSSAKAFILDKIELSNKLNKELTYIMDVEASLASDRATDLKKLMFTNLSILDNLTSSDITSMEDAIEAFTNYIEVPKELISDKKSTGTLLIPELLNEADIYKEFMGKLIFSYQPTLHPDWVEFTKVGTPSGVRHTSLVIKCTDINANIPYKGVIVTITNGVDTHIKKSSAKGYVRFFSLPNALWKITTEYPTYDSIVLENIPTDQTKITKLDLKLQKSGLPTTGSFLITCKNKDTDQLFLGLHATITANNQVINANSDAQLFAENLLPGDYSILVSGSNINTQTFQISITAGSQTTATFPIDPTPPTA